MKTQHTLITITGPSCAGKSTLQALLYKKGFERILSTTTRSMRHGEIDGDAYRFISKLEFDALVEKSAFAENVAFNGNQYGVLGIDVLSKLGKSDCVVVVEPEGKRQFEVFAKKNNIRLLRIFVTNPQEVILERFLTRFGDDFVTKGDDAIEVYVKRLMVMQSVEVGWHMDMNDRSYELILNRFDETTILKDLQDIMRLVEGREISKIAA